MGKPKAVTWISLIAAAVKLRIPYGIVWRYAITGEIRAERRGSRWFVAEEDLAKIASQLAPAAR